MWKFVSNNNGETFTIYNISRGQKLKAFNSMYNKSIQDCSKLSLALIFYDGDDFLWAIKFKPDSNIVLYNWQISECKFSITNKYNGFYFGCW